MGNDWAYFGTFANNITGLTPYQAQGDAFVLAPTPPPVQGQQIRITGYGTTRPPVPMEWNLVQKTHTGPYKTFNGTTVRYATDTTGGNSGSPVINEDTGEAIGIHTHGGCTRGDANNGTGSNHTGLRNAIADPRGVCFAGLEFEYPNGRPEVIAPSGGTLMRVTVAGRNGGVPKPDTGRLYYQDGNKFKSVPMTEVSENVYDAVFPPAGCGSMLRYYVSAKTSGGAEVTDPSDAPASTFVTLVAAGLDVVFEDNFQRDLSWTVENIDLQDGAWERGVPYGGTGGGEPANDFDGSGKCYVTGNREGSDVDGGPTRLTSPPIDMSGGDGFVSYARWFSDRVVLNDRLVVQISDDDGETWTQVERVSSSAAWVPREFRVSQYVMPTDKVRLRFETSDNPDNSVVEAALDAVRVVVPRCETACDEVQSVNVSCQRRGKLKAKLQTTLLRGTRVRMTRDGGDPRQAVINKRGKGRAKWSRQSGEHEVCVAGCPGMCGQANCTP